MKPLMNSATGQIHQDRGYQTVGNGGTFEIITTYLDRVYLVEVYLLMAIRSFSGKAAQIFFETGSVKKGTGWSSISRIAKRKLDILHYAAELGDLKAPPGNKPELLKGKLKGHYSIRINDQWRIVFEWFELGPYDVRITDYH